MIQNIHDYELRALIDRIYIISVYKSVFGIYQSWTEVKKYTSKEGTICYLNFMTSKESIIKFLKLILHTEHQLRYMKFQNNILLVH